MPRRGLGWTPDLPDHRDQYRARATMPITDLPPAVSLRALLPPVYDQGQLGSCTAHGLAGALQYDQAKQGFPLWMPSRLFIYYNERVMERTVASDAGAAIRDGIKSINVQGVCYEELWPYDPARFADRPTNACYEVAKNHPSVRYQRVINDPQQVRAALAGGDVIVFGVTLFESFESDAVTRTGVVPMPQRDETPLGGHCMLAVGYDTDQVLVRNSWGAGWGDGGDCHLPMAYLTNPDLADDFWIIQSIA